MKFAINEVNLAMAAQGVLKTAVTWEKDRPFPHMILEMNLIGGDRVTIGLDEQDLSTIVRHARASKVEKLRDAVR